MTKKLEFKFDPNEDFQLDAIRSVVGVFEGLARHMSEFALGDESKVRLANAGNVRVI